MRRVRIPLYLKFLLWAGLNLLLILLIVYVYAPKGAWGLNLLLTQSVRERLTAIAQGVADDLYPAALREWATVPARHQEIANVKFSAKAIDGPPPPPGPDPLSFRPARLGFPAEGNKPALGLGAGLPTPPIDIRRSGGTGYMVSVPVEGTSHGGPPKWYIVRAHAESLLALLRLLGISRELLFGFNLLAVSALLWWPFIWRITRTVGNLSAATQRMSQGRLDTRVAEVRRDELGDLAAAINTMAQRLEAALHGQRQFLADVAHEVISPVARMQIGLGILEGCLPRGSTHILQDVRDDLDQMANMLSELLLFSRSGIEDGKTAPATIELLPLVRRVISAEGGAVRVAVDVPPTLKVAVPPALLARAVANLIRNANRYAGSSGASIDIIAAAEAGRVKLWVRDRGPGVPDAALARLGEPFYRPELARSRATGGFGLGLAIVRRCITDCDGEVRFSNRAGGGFQAELTLNSSDIAASSAL